MNESGRIKSFFIYQAAWLIAIFGSTCLLAHVQIKYKFRLICKEGYEGLNCDPMAVTGIAATFIGLIYSFLVDRSQYEIIKRLYDNAIINIHDPSWKLIRKILLYISFPCQILFSLFFVLCMIYGYENLYENDIRIYTYVILLNNMFTQGFEISLLIMICALLVGVRVGRIFGNCFTGLVIKKYSGSIRLQIQHSDHAGGLSFVRNFYLLQSSSFLIPILWVLFWIYVANKIPVLIHHEEYAKWRLYFSTVLFPIFFFLFYTCFYFPLIFFRRIIIEWKSKHTSRMINTARYKLINMDNGQYYNIGYFRQTRELSDYLNSLTSLPNWPISPVIKTTFFSIVLPLLLSMATSIIMGLM